MGIHLRVLSGSYPMNTNMTGFRLFSKIFASLCFGRKNNLCIGRVKSHWNQPIFTALGRTLVMRRWSNEYQHDRVLMFFKNLCILGHWMKVASTLEGLDALEGLTQNIFWAEIILLSILTESVLAISARAIQCIPTWQGLNCFQNLCILVHCMKVASALGGLTQTFFELKLFCNQSLQRAFLPFQRELSNAYQHDRI